MAKTNEARWAIEELGAQVALALAVDYSGAANGRVREVPDARTIRYYTTLGLIDRSLKAPGIDLEQQVTLLDKVPLQVIAPQQVAGHLRANVRVHQPFRRADPLAVHRDVSLDDFHDLHFRHDSRW